MKNKPETREFVPTYEQEQVSRGLLSWINQYKNFPVGVKKVSFEHLEDDKPCMTLSTIQGTYVTKRYLGGDYMAEYQFAIIYRGQPTTDGDRLRLNEILDAFGDWAARRREKPNIGENKQTMKIVINARASTIGRNDNGDEDCQILMTMTYYAKRSST